MTLKNLKNRHYSSPLLAFCITFLAFIGVMIAKGFVPFGDSSMLYSVADVLAELKGVSREEILDATFKNAVRVFEMENLI